MFGHIHHGAISLALDGGFTAWLTLWASSAAGGVFALSRKDTIRISRGYFLLFLVIATGLQQILHAGRMSAIGNLSSAAFPIFYLAGLLAMASFSYLLMTISAGRRRDAGWAREFDLFCCVMPPAILALAFASAQPEVPGQRRQKLRKAHWAIYAGVAISMLSISLSGQMIIDARKAMQAPENLRYIVAHHIRTVGIDAYAETLRAGAEMEGSRASISGKRLSIDIGTSLKKWGDPTWRNAQAVAVCNNPLLRGMIDNGYNLSFTRENASPPEISVTSETCGPD
ncbi:hypothetical protein ACEUZ9_004088 [Paracoccus litorisediminis]|uniref:hypothetical protein n=1 Tax=Paracoccus litorisediminis TaxID=2006130 RepID=UPI00372D9717